MFLKGFQQRKEMNFAETLFLAYSALRFLAGSEEAALRA